MTSLFITQTLLFDTQISLLLLQFNLFSSQNWGLKTDTEGPTLGEGRSNTPHDQPFFFLLFRYFKESSHNIFTFDFVSSILPSNFFTSIFFFFTPYFYSTFTYAPRGGGAAQGKESLKRGLEAEAGDEVRGVEEVHGFKEVPELEVKMRFQIS